MNGEGTSTTQLSEAGGAADEGANSCHVATCGDLPYSATSTAVHVPYCTYTHSTCFNVYRILRYMYRYDHPVAEERKNGQERINDHFSRFRAGADHFSEIIVAPVALGFLPVNSTDAGWWY